MFLPLMGMVIVSILLSPFALAWLATVREARNFVSLVLFYLGSGLWLVFLSAISELCEVTGHFPPASLGWLILATPFSGVALNGIRKSRDLPEFRLGMATAGLLVGGFIGHFAYLESFDYNLNVTDSELLGTWRGEEGTLHLTLPTSHETRVTSFLATGHVWL